MLFIAILILTTLSIAGSAAFFSIYGLAQIFTGAFWPVVIMATSLEAGKLVAASYIYRYWKKIGFLMKTYLITAIIILMMITSAGIFGFLSSAYQEDVLPLEEMEEQIVLLDQKKTQLQELREEKIARREQINATISAFPDNYATKKAQARAEFKPELDKLNIDIDALIVQLQQATDEQHKLKTSVIQQKVHTGPIIFIAKALQRPIDDATTWMILLIIFAFDPLAVVLTIGANIAVLDRKKVMGKLPHALEVYEDIMEGEEVGEPDPFITSVDQLLDESPSAVSAEQIKKALDEFEHRQLSPAEIAQKGMLEEMLRRKQVTEKIRNPHKNS